jgi:hypothetical protein
MMFHLVPAFGTQPLRMITRDQMQISLDKKAGNRPFKQTGEN